MLEKPNPQIGSRYYSEALNVPHFEFSHELFLFCHACLNQKTSRISLFSHHGDFWTALSCQPVFVCAPLSRLAAVQTP